MVDDTLYITPHEAALAVVATAMKKSRLRWDVLVVDSIMGAILFSTGGMLYVMCESMDAGLISREMVGIVSLFQGAVYALGLFFVIVTGMELWNSNVLFFTVGLLRGATTFMDLLISWTVTFWVNLGSTIFVVYVICHLSGIFKQSEYVEGTIRLAQHKIAASFMETFLRAIAGNFCVCLAVYLQIMVKPPHVKFLLIFLPIFTFVAMGFTHVVADMFIVPAGLFNNCGYGWGRYFWKIMLPGFLGNVIGGAFFSLAIPWYLHLVVVEQDMRRLNLPSYEEKDEQPMLNMDSRVVRINPPGLAASTDEASSSTAGSDNNYAVSEKGYVSEEIPASSAIGGAIDEDESVLDSIGVSSSEEEEESDHEVHSEMFEQQQHHLQKSRVRHRRGSKKPYRSPKGVFPVADMGRPLKRERTIACAYYGNGDYKSDDNDGDDDDDDEDDDEDDESNPADVEDAKMSTNLIRVITRAKTHVEKDIEEAVEGRQEQRHDSVSSRDSNDRSMSVSSGASGLQRLRTRIQEHRQSSDRKRRPSHLAQQLRNARIPPHIAAHTDFTAGAANESVNSKIQRATARRMRKSSSTGSTRSSLSSSMSPPSSDSLQVFSPVNYTGKQSKSPTPEIEVEVSPSTPVPEGEFVRGSIDGTMDSPEGAKTA